MFKNLSHRLKTLLLALSCIFTFSGALAGAPVDERGTFPAVCKDQGAPASGWHRYEENDCSAFAIIEQAASNQFAFHLGFWKK